MFEPGTPKLIERTQEQIADSVVFIEKDGTLRKPYFDAWEPLMPLKDHGFKGGCAESAASFIFGKKYIEELGLMPDFNLPTTTDDQRVIRMRDRLGSNFFDLSTKQNSYRPQATISVAREEDILREIEEAGLKRFLLCTTGLFPDEDPLNKGGMVKTGHMIGGIRCELDNLIPEMANLKPNQFSDKKEFPWWVFDANDFKSYNGIGNIQNEIFPSSIAFPPGLRLLRPSRIVQLAKAYSVPHGNVSIKGFYE